MSSGRTMPAVQWEKYSLPRWLSTVDHTWNWEETANAELILHTGGKNTSQQQNLFGLKAKVYPVDSGFNVLTPAVSPNLLTMDGKQLGSDDIACKGVGSH